MADTEQPFAPVLPLWRDRLLMLFRRRGWRGFETLRRFLKPPGARPGVLALTRYGSRFILDPGDVIDAHVLWEGFYESEVLEAVRPALGPGAVLWVVGANFGLHAVTAKHLFPEAAVVAFEPSPAMAARILENAGLNGAKVDLHAYALGDQTRGLPFFANASGNPGMSTVHPVGGFHYDQRMVIAALTPADVIARGLAPAPTAMIVDAEGMEIEVLRGFGSLLSSPALRMIVFESANDFLETRSPADLHGLLTGAGLALRRLDRNENTAHTLSNFVATRA